GGPPRAVTPPRPPLRYALPLVGGDPPIIEEADPVCNDDLSCRPAPCPPCERGRWIQLSAVSPRRERRASTCAASLGAPGGPISPSKATQTSIRGMASARRPSSTSARPQFQQALASPRRSPISRAIARFCS